MDLPQTLVPKQRFVPRNYRVSKSELIDFITSIEFDDITIPGEFAHSLDEANFQPLIESLMTALGEMIIHNSPPKLTHQKLLARLKTVHKLEKETPIKTFNESIDEDLFGSPGTPIPSASLSHDNHEHEIVRRFLQKNPFIPKESVILPDDPVERDRRLHFMDTVTIASKNTSGTVPVYLDSTLIDTDIPISQPRRAIRSTKPSQPLSPKEYDYFMKNRDRVMNAPLPSHILLQSS